jgi:hypothetical protein
MDLVITELVRTPVAGATSPALDASATHQHFTLNALAVFFQPMSRSPNVLRSSLWDETRTANNTSTIRKRN